MFKWDMGDNRLKGFKEFGNNDIINKGNKI